MTKILPQTTAGERRATSPGQIPLAAVRRRWPSTASLPISEELRDATARPAFVQPRWRLRRRGSVLDGLTVERSSGVLAGRTGFLGFDGDRAPQKKWPGR